MVRLLGFIAALTLLAASPAEAQTPGAAESDQEPPATVDDIIVTARTLREQVQSFVDEVAQPAAGRGLARWAHPACFGVVNFRRDPGRQIADRLVARADELGLPVGEVDCEPNVFIIAVADASDVATAWVERNPEVFQPRFSGAVARPSALRRFMSSDAAVRWWHVSLPISFDIFTGLTQPAVRIDGRIPFINIHSKSQQGSRVRDDFLRVIMLLDVDKLETVALDQLCDYLLMVAYAQIDLDADTASYQTILNLFDDSLIPGLTDWDRSYLGALYSADPTRRLGSGLQAERMADELRRDDAPDAR